MPLENPSTVIAAVETRDPIITTTIDSKKGDFIITTRNRISVTQLLLSKYSTTIVFFFATL